MNKKIFGIICISIAVIEFILCFYGPLALQKKPSLFLFPIKSYGLKDDEIEDITAFIEQSFANSRSFAIISQFVVIEYIKGKDLDIDIPGPELDLNECQKIAEILEFDRYVTCFALKHSEGIRLTIRIRNTKFQEVEIPSILITSTDVNSLINNSDGKGNDFRIIEQIKVTTKGISFYDLLYFIILIAQVVTGILMIIGFNIENVPEIIWVFALMLFLFAYIYALNANMDYMQRFIASSGRIGLEENTFLEQLFAVIRFGPLLIINGWYYFRKRRRKKDDPDIKAHKESNIVLRVSSYLKASVKKWGLFYALLSAVLFGFSFPSVLSLKGFFFLAWISLIPLFLVFIYCRYSWALFYGVTFGTIQSLIINYWHGTFGYLSLHFTTVIHLLYFIAFMIPLVFIVKKSKKWGFILVPVVWTVFDFLRSTGFLGYPWGLIGSSQYQFIPLIQTAAVTGIWGVSFIVILFNSSIAWSLAGLNENWSFFNNKNAGKIPVPEPDQNPDTTLREYEPFLYKANSRKESNKETGIKGIKGFIKQYFPVFIFLCVFLISIAGGSIHSIIAIIKMNNNEYKQVKLVLIQQNTDPRKHDYRLSLKNLRTLTDTALDEIDEKPDMVVWSEGAFSPDTRYYGAKERNEYDNVGLVYEFFDYQKTIGTWLLTGNDDHRIINENGKMKRQNFNSSVLFNPEGVRKETYHKMHLVPFTEYFPWKEELPEMYELLQSFDISDWTKGEERIIFEHPKFSFITPICFEDVFSDDIRLFISKGVDIIVNISNDYWSLTPVEGTQHGIIALFRAVENQRPMVRSTSSGYTVHIDSLGRIREGAPEPYTGDYCEADVFLPHRNLTIYTMFGDWFPVLCVIITIGAFIVILISVFKRK